jgi:hypothetical protein
LVFVRYGDGETLRLDLEHGITTSLSSLLGSAPLLLAIRLPGTQRSALVTASTVVLESDGRVVGRRHLPLRIDRAFEGDGVVVAIGHEGVLLLRPSDMELIGQIARDEAGRSLGARLASTNVEEEEANEAAVSDFAEVGPRRWRILTRRDGQLESWTIKPSPSGLQASQDAFRMKLGNADQTWYTYRRIGSPDTLLFKAGSNTEDGFRSPFEQFDLTSGKPVTRFVAPEQGWPEQVLEIESMRADGDEVSILLGYVLPGTYQKRVAVGTWLRAGGACTRWVDLGAQEGPPLYLSAGKNEDPTVAMFWANSDRTRARLVDLSKGKEIWTADVPAPGLPPPFLLAGDGGQWLPAHSDWYLGASHELMIRGRAYWQEVTLVDLPPEQRQRIQQLK